MSISSDQLLAAWNTTPDRLPRPLGESTTVTTTSVVNLPPVPSFSREVQEQLVRHAVYGLTQSWTIPPVMPPLTDREITFLQSHTLMDLVVVAPQYQESPFVERFALTFFTTLATQITVDFVQDLVSPTPDEIKGDSKQVDEKEAQHKEPSAKPKSASKQVDAPKPIEEESSHHKHPLKAAGKSHADHKSSSSERPAYPSPEPEINKHKPSREMQKVQKVALKIAFKAGKGFIENKIMEGYEKTAQNLPHDLRAVHLQEGREVSKFVSKSINGLATAGAILHKTYESGESLRIVILEGLKDQTVDYFISKGAHAILSASPYVLSKAMTNGLTAGLKEVLEPPPCLNIGEDGVVRNRHIEDRNRAFLKERNLEAMPPLSTAQDKLRDAAPGYHNSTYTTSADNESCAVM